MKVFLIVFCIFLDLTSTLFANSQTTVLITGGAGYIGSHIAVELLNAGYNIVIVDNLINSKRVVIDRIEKITGKKPKFYHDDLRDEKQIGHIFDEQRIDAVIHLAGLKAVAESTKKPLLYYDNNVSSTMRLLQVMSDHDCHNLIFSSSATVYGEPEYLPTVDGEPKKPLPYDEQHPVSPVNPYGRTKLIIEKMLMDMASADEKWNFIVLRYFNPIGAHESGEIGEDPRGRPNNLMPYILQVVSGKEPFLKIYGDKFPTKDGTAVRDYVHVVDLAQGHVEALQKLSGTHLGFKVYNLGGGKGSSVKDIVNAVSKAWGKQVPSQVEPPRDGDLPEFFANTDLAKQELGWSAKLDIMKMVEDSLNWIRKNPKGFDENEPICEQVKDGA